MIRLSRLLTITFTTADFVRSSLWQFEAPPTGRLRLAYLHLSYSRTLRVFLTQPPHGSGRAHFVTSLNMCSWVCKVSTRLQETQFFVTYGNRYSGGKDAISSGSSGQCGLSPVSSVTSDFARSFGFHLQISFSVHVSSVLEHVGSSSALRWAVPTSVSNFPMRCSVFRS
jgi:hypothetical protein